MPTSNSATIVNKRRPIHENRATISPSRASIENESQAYESASDDYTDEEDLGCLDNTIPQYEEESATAVDEKPKQQQTTAICSSQSSGISTRSVFILVIVGLFVTLPVSVYVHMSETTTAPPKQRCTFDKLRQQHPQQTDKVWRTLSVGVELILNKAARSPSVILFLHQNDKAVNRLINDIAAAASQCLDHKTSPIKMDMSDFNSAQAIEDYGYAIEQYKEKIKKGSVILIANLNEIPTEAAPALHSICDTENPIVKDVVIFLTLGVNDGLSAPPADVAYDALNKLWGEKLAHNILGALITRVTDQVISLKN